MLDFLTLFNLETIDFLNLVNFEIFNSLVFFLEPILNKVNIIVEIREIFSFLLLLSHQLCYFLVSLNLFQPFKSFISFLLIELFSVHLHIRSFVTQPLSLIKQVLNLNTERVLYLGNQRLRILLRTHWENSLTNPQRPIIDIGDFRNWVWFTLDLMLPVTIALNEIRSLNLLGLHFWFDYSFSPVWADRFFNLCNLDLRRFIYMVISMMVFKVLILLR